MAVGDLEVGALGVRGSPKASDEAGHLGTPPRLGAPSLLIPRRFLSPQPGGWALRSQAGLEWGAALLGWGQMFQFEGSVVTWDCLFPTNTAF